MDVLLGFVRFEPLFERLRNHAHAQGDEDVWTEIAVIGGMIEHRKVPLLKSKRVLLRYDIGEDGQAVLE